jgi:hypothetical protein
MCASAQFPDILILPQQLWALGIPEKTKPIIHIEIHKYGPNRMMDPH